MSESKQNCCVCLDEVSLSDGIAWNNKDDIHFSCFECIEGQTRANAESALKNGVKRCGYQCKVFYSEQSLAAALSTEVYCTYQAAREEAILSQAELIVSQRMERQKQQLAAMETSARQLFESRQTYGFMET